MHRPLGAMTCKRLLVINPNTNAAVTEQARLASIAAAAATTRIDAVNPEAGPFAVEGDGDRAIAAPHVVSIIRDTINDPYDGYVLACFDDIGIVEGRALVRAPVISMAEAAIRAAAGYERFAIVTTVAVALPSISALLRRYGVADRCAVAATGIGVAETAARTQNAERALLRTIGQLREQDGAQSIILGSGAYTGRRQALAESMGISFIDGLEAAISHCERGH